MALIKKRDCPECGGKMEAKLINLAYHKQHSGIHVEVIGIPANVCTKCYYRIIPAKIAKYIDTLIDPIFESDKLLTEKVLPSPHIGIQFTPMGNEYFCNE
jgi:YgiT-type zinc finger domain-containing protein